MSIMIAYRLCNFADAIRAWYAEAKRDIGELKEKKVDAIRAWYAEAKNATKPRRLHATQMQSVRGTLRQSLDVSHCFTSHQPQPGREVKVKNQSPLWRDNRAGAGIY